MVLTYCTLGSLDRISRYPWRSQGKEWHPLHAYSARDKSLLVRFSIGSNEMMRKLYALNIGGVLFLCYWRQWWEKLFLCYSENIIHRILKYIHAITLKSVLIQWWTPEGDASRVIVDLGNDSSSKFGGIVGDADVSSINVGI